MLLMLILSYERKSCPVEAYVYLNTSLLHLALLGKMEELGLCSNHLKGSLDLHRLPAAVRILSLSSNEFTGYISLEKLPKGLIAL